MHVERFEGPHEFHVTVDPDTKPRRFIDACRQVGVKPLEIYNLTL